MLQIGAYSQFEICLSLVHCEGVLVGGWGTAVSPETMTFKDSLSGLTNSAQIPITLGVYHFRSSEILIFHTWGFFFPFLFLCYLFLGHIQLCLGHPSDSALLLMVLGGPHEMPLTPAWLLTKQMSSALLLLCTLFNFCFILEWPPAGLRLITDSVLRNLLLVGFEGPNGVLGIKPRFAICQASDISQALNFKRWNIMVCNCIYCFNKVSRCGSFRSI